jgi:chromosome condensin MukBEF complex kleisin-like MukF subunit
MKFNEIRVYKNIGLIQKVRDESQGAIYEITHNFMGKGVWQDTIKEAEEALDEMQADSVKLKEAIRLVRRSGYQVLKELDKYL